MGPDTVIVHISDIRPLFIWLSSHIMFWCVCTSIWLSSHITFWHVHTSIWLSSHLFWRVCTKWALFTLAQVLGCGNVFHQAQILHHSPALAHNHDYHHVCFDVCAANECASDADLWLGVCCLPVGICEYFLAFLLLFVMRPQNGALAFLCPGPVIDGYRV